MSTYGMRKKSSSRFSSGTSHRSLLPSARHAFNTCSSSVFARKLDIAVAAGIVDRETLDAAVQLLHAHIRLCIEGGAVAS